MSVLHRLCCGKRMRHQLRIPLSRRDVHSGRPPAPSFFWLSDEGSVPDASISSLQTTVPNSSAFGSASTASFRSPSEAPPLLLDPPFTPVPGETVALEQWERRMENTALLLLYTCAVCASPLFCSSECTHTSTPGDHRSGWPSFKAPVCTEVLRLRSLLQRIAVERGGGGGPLRATLAARGMAVEGDMVRQTRGAHCKRVVPQTWREACLRDENKRSDPTILEGCCAVCSTAVCRVVPVRRSGVKYVANPTALLAKLAEEAGK